MLRVRRIKSLQKFASVHANVHNYFNSQRQLRDTRLLAQLHWLSEKTLWPKIR